MNYTRRNKDNINSQKGDRNIKEDIVFVKATHPKSASIVSGSQSSEEFESKLESILNPSKFD